MDKFAMHDNKCIVGRGLKPGIYFIRVYNSSFSEVLKVEKIR